MATGGDLKEHVDWYEATLSLKERRSLGHFSTPPRLVEQILDACAYTSDKPLANLRVLDPACGSGNFLAEAARRLISSLRSGRDKSGPTVGPDLSRPERSEEIATLIQRNVWGFDPDPISCFLAEMQLSSIVKDELGTLGTDTLHIHQADGLALRWGCEPCVDLFLANPPYLAAKNTDLSAYQSAHQHGQADSYLLFLNLGLQIVRPNGWMGLVLPDAILARTNAARERACLLKDFTIHHLWHLAGVFAAQVGAVVIVAQKCASKSTHMISWVRGQWKADVGALSEARRSAFQTFAPNEAGSPRQSAVLMTPPLFSPSSSLHPYNHTHSVPQSLLLQQPRAELRYLLSSEQGSSIERLRAYLDETSHIAPLSNFVLIRRGEELGRKSSHLIQALPCDGTCKGGRHEGSGDRAKCSDYLSPRQGPPCGCRGRDQGDGVHPTCSDTPCGCRQGGWPENGCRRGGGRGGGDAAWYPVLRGGRDVRPYAISFSNWWIPREAIVKPLERYSSPKLLVVKSTNRLQAALDTQGRVTLQTLYLLHPYSQMKQEHEATLYFLLALLNSRLLQTYMYVLHTAYKWVQPQIDQHVLARLPIPIIDSDEKQQIIERSRLLACACSELDPVVEWKQEIQGIYEEQERAICALYNAALPGLFC